jgi:hypothetical protein
MLDEKVMETYMRQKAKEAHLDYDTLVRLQEYSLARYKQMNSPDAKEKAFKEVKEMIEDHLRFQEMYKSKKTQGMVRVEGEELDFD